MVQKITNGIRISVETNFEGVFYKEFKMQFAFGYKITIANEGGDSVKLESRFWQIKDALNITKTVSGEGVVGVKPVLRPGESHTYKSGCLLTGPIGAMKGHYNMVNLNTLKKIQVNIPAFKLSTPYALN